MSVNCLNLQYSAINASVVTNSHALLAPTLQMGRQIKLKIILIRFESIHLPNRFKSIIHSPLMVEDPKKHKKSPNP